MPITCASFCFNSVYYVLTNYRISINKQNRLYFDGQYSLIVIVLGLMSFLFLHPSNSNNPTTTDGRRQSAPGRRRSLRRCDEVETGATVRDDDVFSAADAAAADAGRARIIVHSH